MTCTRRTANVCHLISVCSICITALMRTQIFITMNHNILDGQLPSDPFTGFLIWISANNLRRGSYNLRSGTKLMSCYLWHDDGTYGGDVEWGGGQQSSQRSPLPHCNPVLYQSFQNVSSMLILLTRRMVCKFDVHINSCPYTVRSICLEMCWASLFSYHIYWVSEANKKTYIVCLCII